MPGGIFDGISAVIFDMDGTLVDSMWVWRDIDNEYLKNHGLTNDLLHEEGIEGMSFHETAVYFKKYYGIKDDVETIKDQWNEMAYERYALSVPYKKGAVKFLEACLDADIRMGIATSNSRTLAEAAGGHLRFDKYFSAVVTADEIIKGKPAPDVYLKAAEKLKTRPCECLVFEDLCQGIMAGHNAGMKVCAVEDEYSHADRDKKAALADYFINDFDELLKEWSIK